MCASCLLFSVLCFFFMHKPVVEQPERIEKDEQVDQSIEEKTKKPAGTRQAGWHSLGLIPQGESLPGNLTISRFADREMNGRRDQLPARECQERGDDRDDRAVLRTQAQHGQSISRIEVLDQPCYAAPAYAAVAQWIAPHQALNSFVLLRP